MLFSENPNGLIQGLAAVYVDVRRNSDTFPACARFGVYVLAHRDSQHVVIGQDFPVNGIGAPSRSFADDNRLTVALHIVGERFAGGKGPAAGQNTDVVTVE